MAKKERRKTIHHNLRVSDETYQYVKKMSADPKYKGRGLVGVLDDMILGKFTTSGSGRYRKKV